MRLTFVISTMRCGGAQRVMAILANEFLNRGHEVSLITLDATNVPPQFQLERGIRVLPTNLLRASPNLFAAIQNGFWRLHILRKALNDTRPDALISFIDTTNVLVLLATRGLGIPVVVSERVDPAMQPIAASWNLLRSFLYPLASKIAFQTERGMNRFGYLIRRKGMVIPNPVLAPDFDEPEGGIAKEGSSRHCIVAMGRLDPQKGFDLLLRAFAPLATQYSQWHLIIYGEGEMRKALEKLSAHLGLGTRATFPGITAKPYEALRHADLFVLSSRYEGIPNALCEAMACGLPVISFDCPTGPREILRHEVDGILVPPEDLAALSTAMARLMSDQGLRSNLAKRAPEILQRFGIASVMELWETVLREVTD